jgi:hypothetical protein
MTLLELEYGGHVIKMNILIFGGSGTIDAAVAWDWPK